MYLCKGCGNPFKRSGLLHHFRRSENPACRALQNDLPTEPPPPETVTESALDETRKRNQIPADPHGDFFGNYAEYSVDDFGIEDEDDGLQEAINALSDEEDPTEAEEEDEAELADAVRAEEEAGLEPKRPQAQENVVDAGEDEIMMGPYCPALRLRGGAEEALSNKPIVVQFCAGNAGAKQHGDTNLSGNAHYDHTIHDTNNMYAPFSSQLEWEIARWAKLRGPGSNAFTELMSINGVVERLGLSFKNTLELNKLIDYELPGRPPFQRHEVLIGSEVCEVYFRDVIACVKALFADPDLAQYLIVVPEKHYTLTEDGQKVRMYHDMHTGKWWWSTQEQLENDKPGATIVPIILSTDKTQLTLFRNKSAYPVYMTIGNIPKEIRRKPSSRAYVLLGYLPTTRLEGETNAASRRRQLANLYHACMRKIVEPFKEAGEFGTFMTNGNGDTYRNHPILACFAGDYPEQVLTSGVATGECPVCPTTKKELGEYKHGAPPHFRNLEPILQALDSFDDDPASFLQTCKKAGVKPLVDPFWKDLPYAHIYRTITPDILHQLYQGIMKHLICWVTTACGPVEIDARCRRMPPNHNLRCFMKGITSLSRVTGQEHDQMCRILLGLIIDIPLPGGYSNMRLVRAVRALLDFLYLAQYPVHTDETLELMEDGLSRFHENKDIFIDLGIREAFNIPKLHFARHYVMFIKLYGTTDNFDTAYTERLHIDFAKDAYAATNHKDEFTQMTNWLERKEKIFRHDQYIKWRKNGSPNPKSKHSVTWQPPGLELDRHLCMAKHPSAHAVPIDCLVISYGAAYFRPALARFVALANEPNLTGAQLEAKIHTIRIPFRSVPVWHRIKYLREDPFTQTSSTADAIHVRPSKTDRCGRGVPGRFDTALINDGTGGATGIQGYRVGRLRVVFSLPKNSHHLMFTRDVVIPDHLAYVEWYTRFPPMPDRNLLMHKISPLKDQNGGHICSIIPLVNIRRSVHLFPKFGPHAPEEWTSSNVLDMCGTFFVNSFTDRHLYRILM